MYRDEDLNTAFTTRSYSTVMFLIISYLITITITIIVVFHAGSARALGEPGGREEGRDDRIP